MAKQKCTLCGKDRPSIYMQWSDALGWRCNRRVACKNNSRRKEK